MIPRFATFLLLFSLCSPAAAQFEFKSPISLPGTSQPGSAPASPFANLASGEPVEISAQFTSPAEGQPAVLMVTATIRPEYHIYATTQPPGGPGGARIVLSPSEAYRPVQEFRPEPLPQTHYDAEVWDLDIHEHTGEVTWYAPLELAPGVDPASLTIRGKVTLQACDADSCLPLDIAFAAQVGPGVPIGPLPVTPQVLNISASSTTRPTPPTANTMATTLLLNLGGAFLGGLILNLMPCVLPVIGLKVLSFAEQGGQNRLRVLGLNLAYSAGLIGVFLVLAALAAYAGYGWGQLYTLNVFKLGMVYLVFAMALSFLGVWEIPIPGFAGVGKANDLQAKEGVSGAFFKGVFTTLLATPCSGPFLGPVIGYTLTQSPTVTFLIFFCMGLGMASPYLLIGAFPGLVRWLPKPGMWMETFKQIMGFVLMGTVVFLMWSVNESLYLPVLTTLVAIGFACWWIGRTPITASQMSRTTSWVGGIAISFIVGWFAFGAAIPSTHELAWKPYNEASLAAAQQSGRVTLVDFSADWCLTCKLNLKQAINTARVQQVVESNGVIPLLADWTDGGEAIKAKLEALGSRSIPLLAIYPAGRPNDPIVLRDVISESQLLEALRQAGATLEGEPAMVIPSIEIGDANGASFR